MTHEPTLKKIQKEWHGSFRAYGIGFILSFFLTLASFFLVLTKIVSGTALTLTLTGLALFQAICQVRFFLHLGKEPKPHSESLIFYFMVLTLLIFALGTLWIMNDLNERVMTVMTLISDLPHD